MLDQLKSNAKTVGIVGTLTLSQLIGWSVTIGEYKSRIVQLEEKVDAHTVENRDLRKSMDELRIAIISLTLQMEKSHKGTK
jgi:hypothetical protein